MAIIVDMTSIASVRTMANIANTIATTMICNEHDCATTMSMHYHYHDQHCKRHLDNYALLLPRLSQLPLSQSEHTQGLPKAWLTQVS